MTERISKLHQRALAISTTHRKSEAELISVLQEIDSCRGYLQYGARSLYDYCERILKLSEGTSYNLITVARRAKQIPALKDAVESGSISVSKARRIAPVLTKENQAAWLELASTKSSREIERAVADVNPQTARPERYQAISSNLTRTTLDLPEHLMKKLRRVQDIESQRLAKHATMIEALEAMADLYLERRDPVVKAERAREKTKVQLGTCRVPSAKSKGANRTIPAAARHAVYMRDRGQCTYTDESGRCSSTRWLEIHHVVLRSEGGNDEPANLKLLCGAHHRALHRHSHVRAPTKEYVACA